LASLKVLEAYFEVCKKQNWVNEKNFEVLKREYNKVGEFLKEKTIKKEAIKKEVVLKDKPVKKQETNPEITNKDIEYEKLSDIQLKLLEYSKTKASLSQMKLMLFSLN
jgi:predicted RNA methylase